MSDTQGSGLNGSLGAGGDGERTETAAHRRVVGSPLPTGPRNSSSPPSPPPGTPGDSLTTYTPPPPGRALGNASSNAPLDMPSGVQRAISGLRAALPWVQRILPLLDGNIGTAVSNILTPHHHPPPPPPPVNFGPIEDGLAELQNQQRELRNQVVEQNSSLKRVEDQLEMVREATDRNTLEQQELLEDLKVVGNKVNLFAMIAIGLLALSVLLNIVLYLHILRVLP
jgi:hypothetical protein